RGVSRRLRAAAVRKAERLAERLDLHTVVPAARAWRWFWAAALVVAVAGPLAAWKPALAAAALVRLVDPFGHHPYPAKTRIDFLSPAFPIRLPKGEGLDIRFAVTGVIPDRATVAVRVAGGDEWQEDYPLAPDEGKPAAGAAVTARLDGGRLVNTFAVRVTANDADTGWLDVAVVPPPRLVPLDGRPSPQVSAIPPAYTGLSPVELPDGAAVVEVPVGTVVSLRAAADVPLARAVLTFVGDRTPVEQPAGLAAVGHLNPLAALGGRLLADVVAADIPLTVSGDGRTMTATFTPSLSGMYALRMSDDDGVQGSRLLELRLVPDPAPVVTLLRPAPGRDTLLVVPTAAVPVRVAAEDEVYAVRRTFLEYRVGRDGQLKTIPLADARRSTDPLAAAAGVAATTLRPPVVRAEAGMILPVAGFLRDDGTPARDGDVVVLRGAADDHDDVTVLKDPGRSGDIELRVATPEAVEAEVQKELAGLRPELIRLREQQREVNRQTAGLTPQPDGTLSPADRSVLQAAEAAQRQVRGKVADPRDGLRAKADLLRETARANGLPKSQTTDRLDAVADELGRLADRDLAAIDPKLGDARQLGAQPPKPGQEGAVPNLLAQAGRHQKAVEEGLTTLLDLLARWGDAAEIRGEARVLRDAARRGAEAADKLPEKVPPGKPAAGLPPDQQAELERAAGKADQLADQSNALLGRAARLAGEKDAQAGAARSAAEGKEKDAAAAGAEA
ncbi:MAG: hypothetical protein K2X82_20580, partial [Gemmataceae bacterium]|nr:hypothetical protein [Gemmataceae bacterium]